MIKNNSRRKFIELGVKSSLAIPILGSALLACDTKRKEEDRGQMTNIKKLNILILGGTSFLGPHQIAYALDRGHSISIFTRGKTKPTIHQQLFDKVEHLIGDRANDLSALENRKWDAVIDNSGHNVEWTKKSAALLEPNVDQYLFTSSTGVYYPYLKNNSNEETKVLLVEPEGIDDDDERKMEYWYGVMKSNSELAAENAFGTDRTIVVRPTYMIGPADKSDRFIYWPVRLSRGGEIMVPGKEQDPVQYIDVRDVAEWMIRLIEEKKAGTYNAVGPKQSQDMSAFVDEASSTFNVESTFVKIDDYEFLKQHNVPYLIPWIMPVGNNLGSATINNTKGIANGLTFRPLPKSMKDIYDWWYSDALTQERRDQFELKPESTLMREAAIIEAWNERNKS